MYSENAVILPRDPRQIKKVCLGLDGIGVEELVAIARYGAVVEFSAQFIRRVRSCRGVIERFVAENRLIYGVTTGFGENVRYVITPEEASALQRNVILSCTTSVGRPLEREQVRAIMVMSMLNTGAGHSGISLEMISMYRDLLNQGITPYAPGEGSVGRNCSLYQHCPSPKGARAIWASTDR